MVSSQSTASLRGWERGKENRATGCSAWAYLDEGPGIGGVGLDENLLYDSLFHGVGIHRGFLSRGWRLRGLWCSDRGTIRCKSKGSIVHLKNIHKTHLDKRQSESERRGSSVKQLLALPMPQISSGFCLCH